MRSSIVNSPAAMRSSTGSRSLGLGLREEADLAEVDAEERDVDLGDGSRGAEERAVTTEDDERIGRPAARASERLGVAGLGLPVVDAVDAAPAGGARGSSTVASIVGLYAKPIRRTVTRR